ncbi:MAG: carbamoyltransferase HypF [Acidaminococcaceae bacterium]|nr:carbamoyltransferase HypF [Acidaminococcaceae bacterium]
MEQRLTAEISVYGKVQGVGFRPLVCRLAETLGVTGLVRNAGTHVDIIATGESKQIEKLCERLRNISLPVHVDDLVFKEVPFQEFTSFHSVHSTESEEIKYVSSDIGICDNCLHELKEKGNRREGYSYISCAQCGPRYTIIRKLPYDRENTTMDQFSLCDDCAEEYNDMHNRRGHGETISCYHCGPQLQCFLKEGIDNNINENTGDSPDSLNKQAQDKNIIAFARELLTQGQIIMVKAVGGFNLVCRADNADVVMRLRDLKKRMSKPFAVMVTDTAQAEKFCCLTAEEKSLLQSAARPIVLCKKRENSKILLKVTVADVSPTVSAGDERDAQPCHLAENVTDVSDQVGVFLPSMGFYACLETSFPLIVTSCNYTGQPIIYKDEEAQRFFAAHKDIAALFTYEREILRPADDAVTRIVNGKLQMFRRTKGYMPEAVTIRNCKKSCDTVGSDMQPKPTVNCQQIRMAAFANSKNLQNCVLALGAQMEPGFCLAADGTFFPAEIPGDITLEKTEQFFADSVEDWMQLLNIKPQAVVADLHPGYATTQWGKVFAEKNGMLFYQVQHHHAHALAVMAEHNLQGKTLAVCFDGTGMGTDGTVWGGEFLLCEDADFTRVGHVKTISMLGGDISMQQAWKTALCHLAAAGIENSDARLPIVKAALKQRINCIETSSMGRLFDAAASLLGLADFNSHQGRCAMALEAAARVALMEKIKPLRLAFAKEEAVLDKERNCSNTACKEVSNINGETKYNWKKAVYNPAPLWKALLQAQKEQKSIYAVALGFHYAVVSMVIDMAESSGVRQIALCGGCFANRILLENCVDELQKRGFAVYYNQKVSCGDGGISLGQAYYGLLRSSLCV